MTPTYCPCCGNTLTTHDCQSCGAGVLIIPFEPDIYDQPVTDDLRQGGSGRNAEEIAA